LQSSAYNNLSHHYEVYGITLACDTELPGLEAEKVAQGNVADIRISLGFIPADIQHLIEQHATPYYLEPGYESGDPDHLAVTSIHGRRYHHFVYGAGVEFLLDSHDSIVWCRWQASLTLEDVALYLLGPILGFMLRLRGTTCLHASGVLVNGIALAITGSSGAGKSTLAASFAAAGYPILTDDVLPLTTINGAIHTQSGYSRLRLFPNSFKNLQELPDELPLLAPGWDKCFLDLASGNYQLHKTSAPLKVVYVVDWGATEKLSPAIIPIGGTAAVSLLAANTYRNELLSADMKKQEFYFLSAMAATVKVRKLCPVDDIASIPLLREMLLADFEQVTKNEQFELAEQAESGAPR
jgi:hypothetical protein